MIWPHFYYHYTKEMSLLKQFSKIFLLICACIFLFSVGVSADTYTSSVTMHEDQSQNIYKKEKCKNLSYTLNVTLSDSARSLARTNELVYHFNAALYCATSRTFERTIDIICYDESGNEIRGGAYHINEENYIVTGTTYHYESNNTAIPGGTKTIRVFIENDIGTKQTMSIDADFSINSTRNNNSYIDKDTSAKASFDLKEYYAAGDTVGEGMTLQFYDIFSDSAQGVSLSDPTTLYRNALINQNNFYNWSQFAYQAIKASGCYRDPRGGGFDADFGATDNNGNPGYYNDLISDFLYASSEVIDVHQIYANSSGLKHGSSMDAIFNEFTDNLAMERNSLLKVDDPSPLEGADYRKHHALTKDGTSGGAPLTTSSGDIFYTYVCNTDREDTAKYDYNGFLLLFYDFNMTAVCDDTVYETMPNYDTPVIKTTVTTNRNAAATTTGISNSWTYSDSFSNTLSSSNTTTDAMTHGWNVNIGGKFSVKEIGGASLSLGASGSYTTSEAYTFSDSKSSSETYSQSSGESLSVDLPAYTVGELVSTTTTGTATSTYACPIEITYKVALVAVNGRFYDDGTAITDWYDDETRIWILGDGDGDAVGDLRTRGLKDSAGTSDPIPWDTISTQGAPCSTTKDALLSGKALLESLGTNYPVTYDQAVASYASTYTSYEVNVYPSDPLYRTAVTKVNSVLLNRNDILYTTPGNYYDITGNITVGGFNSAGAEYYGFVMSEGSWSLEYFDGTAVPENVAKLTKNDATNKVYLHIDADYATNNASALPILLVYHINKDVYKSYEAKSYVNDEDLATKAALTVKVTDNETVIADSAASFRDISSGDDCYSCINYIRHFRYMIGVSPTEFAPNAPITRGQFVTILHRIADEKATDGSFPFRDVPKESYYRDAISWAAEKGIIKGISETLFAPDAPLTREQMATILYRYAAAEGYSTAALDTTDTFRDSDRISEYAKAALGWAHNRQLILGTDNDLLAPGDTATRSQTAMVIHRFCLKIIN